MSARLRELRDEMAQVIWATEPMIDRWIATINDELAEREAQAARPAMTARWGVLAREGDEAEGTHGVRWTRTREELESYHRGLSCSGLVEGADGKLELWAWIDEHGRRARRVRP